MKQEGQDKEKRDTKRPQKRKLMDGKANNFVGSFFFCLLYVFKKFRAKNKRCVCIYIKVVVEEIRRHNLNSGDVDAFNTS